MSNDESWQLSIQRAHTIKTPITDKRNIRINMETKSPPNKNSPGSALKKNKKTPPDTVFHVTPASNQTELKLKVTGSSRSL